MPGAADDSVVLGGIGPVPCWSSLVVCPFDVRDVLSEQGEQKPRFQVVPKANRRAHGRSACQTFAERERGVARLSDPAIVAYPIAGQKGDAAVPCLQRFS